MKKEDIFLFSIDFVGRMRGRMDILESYKPSISQSIAISRLLFVKYLKKLFLTEKDFLNTAVATSHPLTKRIASEVSKETLLYLKIKDKWVFGIKLLSIFGNQSEEEFLKKWFKNRHRDELTEDEKEKMREDAKNALIKLGLLYSPFIRSSYIPQAGYDEGYITRKYRHGIDDPHLIDFNATIGNIISQRKLIEELQYEDFITRQVSNKKRAILYLQDISASLYLDVLLSCAICGSMLVYGLPSCDKIGIGLFENEVHILKSFYEKEEKEVIVEKLLSIEPMKGTNISNALDFAIAEFKKISKYFKKFCFISSDMGFKRDTAELALDKIDELQRMKVNIFFLRFDPFKYFFQEEAKMLEQSGCEIIDMKEVRNFPEIISKIIAF